MPLSKGAWMSSSEFCCALQHDDAVSASLAVNAALAAGTPKDLFVGKQTELLSGVMMRRHARLTYLRRDISAPHRNSVAGSLAPNVWHHTSVMDLEFAEVLPRGGCSPVA